MTVLITMAGMGSRFTQDGYTVPKFKITARGRTLFEWSLLSLRDFFDQPFVLATLGTADTDWLHAKARQLGIHDTLVCPRSALSLGQAETAFDAMASVDPTEPLWIYNIDTYVAHGLHATDLTGFDGCVPVVPSDSPNMSFVRYDEAGAVVEVAEKRVISNWATAGLYGFGTARLYQDVYSDLYAGGKRVAGVSEQYIAPMYDRMLRIGRHLSAPRLAVDAVHVLGTPREVQTFDPEAVAPTGSTRPLG